MWCKGGLIQCRYYTRGQRARGRRGPTKDRSSDNGDKEGGAANCKSRTEKDEKDEKLKNWRNQDAAKQEDAGAAQRRSALLPREEGEEGATNSQEGPHVAKTAKTDGRQKHLHGTTARRGRKKATRQKL